MTPSRSQSSSGLQTLVRRTIKSDQLELLLCGCGKRLTNLPGCHYGSEVLDGGDERLAGREASMLSAS